MNVRLTLFCFFFLSLQGGNACLIDAEDIMCTGTEGGDITVQCSFTLSGWKRMFCKDRCEDGDVLVETEKDRDQRGRYSIYYDERSIFKSALLNVSITNLTKSDSGRYRCGLVRTYFEVLSYSDFEIRVEDAPTSPKPNWTPRPTTQSPGGSSAGATDRHPAAGVLLCVPLTLVVIFIILSAAGLIFYRKRARKREDPAAENEYEFMEASAAGTQSRSPAAGTSAATAAETCLRIQALGSQRKHLAVENEYELMEAGPAPWFRDKKRQSRSAAAEHHPQKPAAGCRETPSTD